MSVKLLLGLFVVLIFSLLLGACNTSSELEEQKQQLDDTQAQQELKEFRKEYYENLAIQYEEMAEQYIYRARQADSEARDIDLKERSKSIFDSWDDGTWDPLESIRNERGARNLRDKAMEYRHTASEYKKKADYYRDLALNLEE